MAKTFIDDATRRPEGLHRYDRAQGFSPDVVRLTGSTERDVIAQACGLLGARFTRSWFSDEVEDWRGAPALWLQWGLS